MQFESLFNVGSHVLLLKRVGVRACLENSLEWVLEHALRIV